MSNIATLTPIEPGERRGGRVHGQLNRVTRAMKIAAMQAAETSTHSDDGTLTGYLRYLANHHPPQFANILARLIPVQMKVKSEGVHPSDMRLDGSMSLSDMMNSFEQKIKSGYVPQERVIEHDDDEASDE